MTTGHSKARLPAFPSPAPPARRFSRVAVLSAGLLGVALVVHQPVRSAALTLLRLPFSLVKTGVGIILTLPQLPSLTAENDRLRTELIQRRLDTTQLQEALRHAHQAEALLQSLPVRQGLIATVIARSAIPTQQTVLLDRGSWHGLSLDSVILHASGVIGRVIEVHPTTCLVLLLTDPESRVAALVERSRETGLLIGEAHGFCQLIYLDVQADVQEGDQVVTAGLGGAFPKGMRLGTVKRVFRNEEAGSAGAWVAPAARLSQLEEVVCLPPAQPALGGAAARAQPRSTRSSSAGLRPGDIYLGKDEQHCQTETD